jgi:tRNA1(Val) A37 N6-methylase TrmN6
MVHSFRAAKASLILAEAIKGGRSGLEVLAPLSVYEGGKTYSDEVASMIAGTRARLRHAQTGDALEDEERIG